MLAGPVPMAAASPLALLAAAAAARAPPPASNRAAASCAPPHSLRIAGVQSCTVSNFSRASRILPRVVARLVADWVSMAEVSDAGLVRESRWRARRAKEWVRVERSAVVLDRRRREAERASIRNCDSVTIRLLMLELLALVLVLVAEAACTEEAEVAAATAAMVECQNSAQELRCAGCLRPYSQGWCVENLSGKPTNAKIAGGEGGHATYYYSSRYVGKLGMASDGGRGNRIFAFARRRDEGEGNGRQGGK